MILPTSTTPVGGRSPATTVTFEGLEGVIPRLMAAIKAHWFFKNYGVYDSETDTEKKFPHIILIQESWITEETGKAFTSERVQVSLLHSRIEREIAKTFLAMLKDFEFTKVKITSIEGPDEEIYRQDTGEGFLVHRMDFEITAR